LLDDISRNRCIFFRLEYMFYIHFLPIYWLSLVEMMSNRSKNKTCCNKRKQTLQSSTNSSDQLQVISLNTIDIYHCGEHV
jgi:hypothetical protein